MSTTPYDHSYKPDLQNLPDPQTFHKVEGKDVAIQKVGVNNLDVLAKYRGNPIEAKVSVYVPLAAGVKGINMSRLVRNLFTVEHDALELEKASSIIGALENVSESCETDTVHMKFRFRVHLAQQSLRSGLTGFQFYDVVLESVLKDGMVEFSTTVDFIYSSACPCSYELAKQAIKERGVDAISHSQRSLARTTVIHGGDVSVENVVMMQRQALVTETQVMVKREDEQAFAEMNGSHPKFVEDAARLMFEVLDGDSRHLDFCSVHEHWESLHSHNAVSVIKCSNPTSKLLQAQ